MKKIVKSSGIILIAVLLTYMLISVIVFDNVYTTSKVIVDEEFHLPMGLAYCKYKFNTWDSKVTTLPGLYLISTLFVAPFAACSTYWLRFVSLGASVINIPLLYILLSKNNQGEWYNIFSSLTLAIIPPVYFFSHFYYTDVVSLTIILLMFVCFDYEYHYIGSFFGFLAVLCRQTNIMWVLYLFGKHMIREMYHILSNTYNKPPESKGLPLEDIKVFKKLFTSHPKALLGLLPLQYILDCFCYISIISAFIIFVVINGSIVVGDKTAHEASINLPQLFYFSLFCIIFSWPHFVGEVSNFLAYIKHHKKIMMLVLILCLIVVEFNTVVHPYLLADNRHYTFYIWNRFYGRYPSFKFTIVPLYIFSWYVILKTMFDKNDITTLLVYLPAIIGLLVPQKLIEVRYFFVPYIIFRLHIKNNSYTVFNLILEFVTYIIINVITFNLFFTKSITWSEYEQPQRLIW